jgi:hypothetical protein
MLYSLKKPCSDCPFRKNVTPYLSYERAEEISSGIVDGDGSFSCHKTSTLNRKTNTGKDVQHCAGAMIIMEKIGKPNQGMRIMERIGLYDRNQLEMDSPVFNNFEEFIKANDT